MSEAHKSIVRRTALPSSVSDPLTTPLYASVAYSSDDADALDAQYDGKTHGYTYAREGHPNASVLAAKIDWLEGAKGGVLTSSGMAGLGAIYLGLLNAGDHIVAGDQLYGRNIRLLTQELPRFGISASLVDSTDAKKIEGAITENTKMILVEAVSNPTLRIADMEGIAKAAKERGVLLVVDNTFTTPASYKPLENGGLLASGTWSPFLSDPLREGPAKRPCLGRLSGRSKECRNSPLPGTSRPPRPQSRQSDPR